MHEYLGIEVPDDAHGVLQDMHWASGLIGYFSTYLLGTVMSVQIWEKADEELGGLDEQIERGEFAPLREWLGENDPLAGPQVRAAGAAAARDRLDDRREAVSRVSQAEVRRARRRLSTAATLAGHGPVAQRIERQPSKLRAVVRFHPGPSGQPTMQARYRRCPRLTVSAIGRAERERLCARCGPWL